MVLISSRDFAFWLQGFFEVAKPKELTPEQTDMVKRHLALVFVHEIDPSLGGDAAALQAVHDGKPEPWQNSHLTAPHKPGEPIARC